MNAINNLADYTILKYYGWAWSERGGGGGTEEVRSGSLGASTTYNRPTSYALINFESLL